MVGLSTVIIKFQRHYPGSAGQPGVRVTAPGPIWATSQGRAARQGALLPFLVEETAAKKQLLPLLDIVAPNQIKSNVVKLSSKTS